MKRLKTILALIIAALLPTTFSACSKPNEPSTKKFVGIAIYQNLNDNLNWSKFNEKHNSINNIISTKDNKINVDEEPTLLFFIYCQNEITSTLNDDAFISNTKRDCVELKDKNLSFRFERIIEDTDILIYYIYKLNTGDYYLDYKDSKSNITNETEIIELEIENTSFTNIKLTLETNLTIKDEY